MRVRILFQDASNHSVPDFKKLTTDWTWSGFGTVGYFFIDIFFLMKAYIHTITVYIWGGGGGGGGGKTSNKDAKDRSLCPKKKKKKKKKCRWQVMWLNLHEVTWHAPRRQQLHVASAV